jgi:uncharacterized protein (DUF983 family)
MGQGALSFVVQAVCFVCVMLAVGSSAVTGPPHWNVSVSTHAFKEFAVAVYRIYMLQRLIVCYPG